MTFQNPKPQCLQYPIQKWHLKGSFICGASLYRHLIVVLLHGGHFRGFAFYHCCIHICSFKFTSHFVLCLSLTHTFTLTLQSRFLVMLKHDTHLLFQPTSGTTTSTSAAATPVTSARTTASSKGLTLVSEEKNICMECSAEYKNAVSCPSGAVSGF